MGRRASSPEQPPPLIRAMRSPGFRWFFAARTISQWGDTFNAVAIVILVYRITGSGLKVGVAAAFDFAPVVLLGFVAGAVADRLCRGRVMVAADLGRAGIAALLTVFHSQLWAVYAAACGLSAFSVFFSPAAASVLPALVSEATWSAPTRRCGRPRSSPRSRWPRRRRPGGRGGRRPGVRPQRGVFPRVRRPAHPASPPGPPARGPDTAARRDSRGPARDPRQLVPVHLAGSSPWPPCRPAPPPRCWSCSPSVTCTSAPVASGRSPRNGWCGACAGPAGCSAPTSCSRRQLRRTATQTSSARTNPPR